MPETTPRKDPLPQDKTKWAYLAALVDGEGCICIGHYLRKVVDRRRGEERRATWVRNHLQMDVAGTRKPLFDWIKYHFGGVYYETDLKRAEWKNRYNWRPQNQQHLKNILLGILPYLVLKREQAILALRYIELREAGSKDGFAELAAQCHRLNAKGKSVETNTPDATVVAMRESDLQGDLQSASLVTVAA